MMTESTETTLARAPETEKLQSPQLLKPYQEADGTFSVLFPSAISADEEGHLLGLMPRSFATREEAAEAVTGVREQINQRFDMISLRKTFGESLPLMPSDKGGFIVIETDARGERHARTFESWQQARDTFIESRPDRPPQERLFELRPTEDLNVVISGLDDFTPESVPIRESYDPPAALKKYIGRRENIARQSTTGETYQHTVAEKEWERQLFGFIQDYTSKEGAHLIESLGIGRLDALSPEQAVQLATLLTVELHKYDESAINGGKNPADKSTALELLVAGRRHAKDAEWQGNGVCRNVAATVKAVFEALKANQTRLSRLTNTYAMIEVGIDDDYMPNADDILDEQEWSAHAWNSFITVSRGGEISGTIVDATWGRGSYDRTGEAEVDYTKQRMEKLVYALASGFSSDTPEYERQMSEVLNFYADSITHPPVPEGSADVESAKRYFAQRALSLIESQQYYQQIPQETAELIAATIGKRMDVARAKIIERLGKLSTAHPSIRLDELVHGFVMEGFKSSRLGDHLVMRDPEAQRMVMADLARERGVRGMSKLLEENAELRVSCRAKCPDLLPPFDPKTRPADRRELKYLAITSPYLARFLVPLDEYRGGESDAPERFMDRADALLRKELGDEVAERVFAKHPSRYERISMFDLLLYEKSASVQR